jgi:hypothetical protein
VAPLRKAAATGWFWYWSPRRSSSPSTTIASARIPGQPASSARRGCTSAGRRAAIRRTAYKIAAACDRRDGEPRSSQRWQRRHRIGHGARQNCLWFVQLGERLRPVIGRSDAQCGRVGHSNARCGPSRPLCGFGAAQVRRQLVDAPIGATTPEEAVGQKCRGLVAPSHPRYRPSPLGQCGGGGVMGVVLVHGNPETSAVWDPLRAALGRDDVICLSPPGFGAPTPSRASPHARRRASAGRVGVGGSGRRD